MQRAWIRAVEGLGAFAWRSSLATWLGGIAINCAKELWRIERRELVTDQEPDPGTARSLSLSAEDRIDLERAIEGLPHGYRQVFVLHDLEGYTHEEIGALLGIESGTSKSQLSHARRRLRAVLDPARRVERSGSG